MEDLLNTDACTMPKAERPLRVAEFDTLFATSVLAVERRDGGVRLRLAGESGLADHVRDLTARESSCCSFFTFDVVGTDSDLRVDISVPPEQQEVLEALADRALELST